MTSTAQSKSLRRDARIPAVHAGPVCAVTGSTSVTSAAGRLSPGASVTKRFATKARAPSGAAATANGSRPAVGRPSSRKGDTERTEMSSDMELATMSRSPSGVGQQATATGPRPTGTEAVSLRDSVSNTVNRSPSRQVTKSCLPSLSRANPKGRPATLARRKSSETVSASATSSRSSRAI